MLQNLWLSLAWQSIIPFNQDLILGQFWLLFFSGKFNFFEIIKTRLIESNNCNYNCEHQSPCRTNSDKQRVTACLISSASVEPCPSAVQEHIKADVFDEMN